jgi:hypothetical protein
MNSLARHIVLRSTGPHRNLTHVFRGRRLVLRHIHATAQKFRWEVRILFRRRRRFIIVGDSKWRIGPPRTLWNSRISSLERKSQFGMSDFGFLTFSHGPTLTLHSDTARQFCQARTFRVHTQPTRGFLIDASTGVSISTCP